MWFVFNETTLIREIGYWTFAKTLFLWMFSSMENSLSIWICKHHKLVRWHYWMSNVRVYLRKHYYDWCIVRKTKCFEFIKKKYEKLVILIIISFCYVYLFLNIHWSHTPKRSNILKAVGKFYRKYLFTP